MTKKKTNQRKNDKFAGLKKNLNLKIRHEVLDQDYIEKLNDEEKEWLSKFNDEFYGGAFKKTKDKKKYSKENLHKKQSLTRGLLR